MKLSPSISAASVPVSPAPPTPSPATTPSWSAPCRPVHWSRSSSAWTRCTSLRVPPTIVCQHADLALEAFTRLGGDVVVKPLFGSEGRGMVRLSDPDLAWRTFRTLERTQSVLYIQQFIAHPGWDLRIFVLGG